MAEEKSNNKKNRYGVLISHNDHNFTEQDLAKLDISKEKANEIITGEAFELINNIDKETSDSILSFYEIKLELKFNPNPSLGQSYQYILNGVTALVTVEQNKLHRDIVNAILNSQEGDTKLKKIALDDKSIQDMLCRAFINNLESLMLAIKKAMPSDQSNEYAFEKEGIFLADKVFLEKYGQQISKKYEDSFKKRFKNLKNKGGSVLSVWFNINKETVDNPFHVSIILKLLADCTWQKESSRIQFKIKYVPALTTGVHKSIESTLSPDSEIVSIKKNRHIEVWNQNIALGKIKVPSTTPKILAAFKGIQELNTLLGHKILRLIIQLAFDQIANGTLGDNAPILRFERGAKEIAAKLGLRSKHLDKKIQEILYALAFFEYSGPKLTGRLIDISKYKSSITHRQEGYLITVLPPLLPYYTFTDSGLLIALLPQPPLVGANQYHAGQMLHAMKLSGEFCRQSINFAKDGAIKLTPETLKSLALQSGILPIFDKVHDRWQQDGTDGPRILEKTDTDYYKFGPELAKYNEFYIEQGEKRLKGKIGGKKSAEIKQKNKTKKKKFA